MPIVSGGGGGGGGATVRGPYTVAYNTPGLTTTGVVLYTFTVPTLVLAAAPFVPTAWTGANPIAFEITCGPNMAALWSRNDMADGGAQPTYTPFPGQAVQNWILAAAGDTLVADAFGVTGMTAGVAAVYALTYAL